MAKVLVLGDKMVTINYCPICHGAGGCKNPDTQQWEDCECCMAEGYIWGDE